MPPLVKFIDDIGYEIATHYVASWIILLRGVFCVSVRHSKRKKLEKGDTFLERSNNHWQKQSLSSKILASIWYNDVINVCNSTHIIPSFNHE